MEEAIILDMSSDDTVKMEKFCTEWSCVKKVVKFITIEGEKVTIVEVGDKKLFEDQTVLDVNL
jgi:hypothetical protein